jgi:hypothetical protein
MSDFSRYLAWEMRDDAMGRLRLAALQRAHDARAGFACRVRVMPKRQPQAGSLFGSSVGFGQFAPASFVVPDLPPRPMLVTTPPAPVMRYRGSKYCSREFRTGGTLGYKRA